MEDPRLSLTAKGLLALLLSYNGQPIDPYEGAIKGAAEITTAVEDFVEFGYALRLDR